MKQDTTDRERKPMDHEPQPVTTGKTETKNGSGENKGYKENRDHTTGAEQGDTRKAKTEPKE